MIVHKIPRRFTSRNDTRRISSDVSIKQKGFTLLEIILAIVAMAVISVVAGLGLVEITKGYIFSKKNAFIAQQGQIAMARLKKEISNINPAVSGPAQATSITYTRNSGGSSHTISWAGSGNPLSFDGDPLVKPVTLFNLKYYDLYTPPDSSYSVNTSIIEITLQLPGAENATIEFKDRVNLNLETGG